MERIAAIVEGHFEEKFIRKAYGNAIIQRRIPNGDHVNLDIIVRYLSNCIDLLGPSIKKVLIMFDRERRTENSEKIKDYILDGLKKYTGSRTFYIAIPDREAENWILADEKLIKGYLGCSNYKYVGDGNCGKAKLLKVLGRDLPPGEKANLLKLLKPSQAIDNSPSLKSFISEVDFPWIWASS